MRETLRRLRIVVMALTLAVAFLYGDATKLGAAPPPTDCAEVCPGASCDTQCRTWVGDLEWFPTCGEYGVCNAEQYCGNGTCEPEIGEDFNNCQDCPPPPPPPPAPDPTTVVLVNGALKDADTSWIYGSPMVDAVAATYGHAPLPFPWTENSFFEVIPPYAGIGLGALDLADFVHSLPEGNVDIVAHSHGGNVAIFATYFLPDRPIRNLINLATPVNWDLDRVVGGAGVLNRCTVSSWFDAVQFGGASTFQQWLFSEAIYNGYEALRNAQDAYDREDWEAFAAYSALAALYFLEADGWWESAKVEWQGATWWANVLGHDLHTPEIWNALVPHCVQR